MSDGFVRSCALFVVITVVTFIIELIYFLPTYLCYRRKSKDIKLVLVVNLLLGWTLVGWVCSLLFVYRDELTDYDDNPFG